MKKNYIVVVVVIIVIIIAIIAGLLMSNNAQTPVSAPAVAAPSATPTAAAMKPTGKLFTGSPGSDHSYMIYPGNPSPAAIQSYNGFDLQTKNLANGLTRVTLFAKKQGYVTQTFVLQPTDKLYFIENSTGDDGATDSDEFLGDDTGVAVSAAGYILQ